MNNDISLVCLSAGGFMILMTIAVLLMPLHHSDAIIDVPVTSPKTTAAPSWWQGCERSTRQRDGGRGGTQKEMLEGLAVCVST